MQQLKTWYTNITTPDKEKKQLLTFIQRYGNKNDRILDVGCGYGRNLIFLRENGYNVVGVEKNPEIVAVNVGKNLPCVSPEAFQNDTTQYDMIILSHIIEHFNPDDLLSFLNFYLSKLVHNGILLIATPLYTDYFYDTFDHVKPYHPISLQLIFEKHQVSMQYSANYKLALRDLWFRRSPFTIVLHRARYIKSGLNRLFQLYDLAMALLYRTSGGWIGKKDGWVGVFQKMQS